SCVGMGSNLISKTVVENRDYSGLEQSVRETLALIKKIRS
ncbi:MAG TPA: bifunctional 4-hydroxy-2-oxoglutarate aldolase/2-dehydro-3-deoxy-phosphogluconate aldolase, partial [Arenibacter sp.]|nr:bifunctional 4-hydroxy-2-oxoglutarate aldolase/2-dehydro-3-deoxy-phosphogluconate aldolase [Arenibacter sp.]